MSSEELTGVSAIDLASIPDYRQAAAAQWQLISDEDLIAHFDSSGQPIYAKFDSTIKTHLKIVKALTRPEAKFVDVAGSLGTPLQAVKKLYLPVVQIIEYYFKIKMAKEFRRTGGKIAKPKKYAYPTAWQAAAKRIVTREDTNTLPPGDLVQSQQEFLPLRISAPPRMGKSAAAMLLVAFAWRIGMKVLYSVSPNKLTPILEMLKKFSVVAWPTLSYKQAMTVDDVRAAGLNVQRSWRAESGKKDYEWHIKETPTNWFDILFYSSDVSSDCERVADMLDGWEDQEVPVLHFHDEAQALAKIAPGTGTFGKNFAKGKAQIALRRAFKNSHGLIVNVTATHMPTLFEPLMWGFTGTGLDDLPMVTSAEELDAGTAGSRLVTSQPDHEILAARFLRGTSTSAPIPLLVPAIRPITSPGYNGLQRLAPWNWKYLPYGMIPASSSGLGEGGDEEEQDEGGDDNDDGDSKESLFLDHFLEYCESTMPDGTPKPMTEVPKGETHQFRPMYIAMLARAIKTDNGTFKHVANMCATVHENELGSTTFLIFSKLIRKDKMKKMFTYDQDEIEAALKADSTKPIAQTQQRVIMIHYNAKDGEQEGLEDDKPRITAKWFMDAQSAIEFSVAEHRTYRIVIAGYAAMQAGLTLQTVVTTKRKGSAAPIFNWFIPEYLIYARRENAPVDEVMQMIGRTFVDTKYVKPPEDHQIQLLSTEGVITTLFAYQYLEDIFNGRIAMPLWTHLNWTLYGYTQEGDFWGAVAAMFASKAPPRAGIADKDWFAPGSEMKKLFAKVQNDSNLYLPSSSKDAALKTCETNLVDLIALWEVPKDEKDKVNSMGPSDRYDRLCEDIHKTTGKLLFGKRRGKMEQLFEPEDEEMDDGS